MKLPGTPFPFLWRYVKFLKWRFGALLLCLLVYALNESLFPYFIKILVENAQTASHSAPISLWDSFRIPILGIGGCWVAMEISMRVYGIVEVYLFPKFRQNMREDVFSWVKEQSIDYFTSNMAGSIGSKIADIPRSSQYIIENFLWSIVNTTFVFTLSLVVVAQASILFALVMSIWFLVHMGITWYFLKEIETKNSDHYDATATLNGETVDIVSNAISMKMFSRVHFETKRLSGFQKIEVRQSMRARFALEKANILRGSWGTIFMLSMVYLLLKGWKEGWVSVGDFPLVAMSSFTLMGMIWQMSHALLDMFRDLGTLKGALSLVTAEHKVKDVPQASALVVEKGSLEFKNITFGYRPHDPIFSNLSTFIPAHQKIGLVGFSGSGKTTFVNLILRAYDLNEGSITIDDQDIATVTQISLRDQVTLIPQDPSLFHRTILENIRYGNIHASKEDVEKAARMAHCHSFIETLENGYDTVVGERGMRLSGGQRQRLAIARAFLKNAPILILDEATSALDSSTERDIQESLLTLMKDKTTLVVAHRLSTLKHMDRILVFHKGRIVEEGSAASLIQKKGHFAHLWSLQQEGFLPEKEV